ncbi:hypothetical protein OG302_09690 [Streptomyces sp. NBC_01283]|uniref:hypothetical protein n=1 Tax=Streptomyces sp. NBC_01283 TaxID=2903812 RepID=UPI00352FA866|nr:hypothetical protein OG302_09690 [Streptomyces sp. NBC_01283]
MAVGQLPEQVREFARYLRDLLARLDPGAGWCGVFWSRDPEGMQACLDGSEVPPWDVVEALLHDLAAGYGAQAAERETERARALHTASLTAYDARAGGRGLLGERLDMMLTEQRFAVERQVELGYSLAAAATQDEVERLNRDLAWVRDDHERATARCAELRERIERLDRADRPQWVDLGTPVSDDFAAVGADDFEDGTAAGPDAGAGGFRSRPAAFGAGAALGAEEFDDFGEQTRNAFGARTADGFGAADGFGTTAGDLDAGSPHPGTRTPEFGTFPDEGAPAPDARTLSADPSGPSDSSGAAAPEAPRVPKQGRKSRDTSRRPRRPRGARFAGFAGQSDDEGGSEAVAVPESAAQSPAANTPRGARFAHAAEGLGGTGEGGRGDSAGPDRDAERATAEAVAALIKLRGEGRSGEAHGVLVEAAGWPAARLPVFAGELHRAGLGADWSTLLWEAASLPPDRLVALADALAGAGRADDCRKLLRQGVSRPAPEIAEAVLALIDAGREREARALLDAYIRVRTPEDAAACAHTDPYRLIPQLLRAAQGVSDERHWDLVHALRVAGFSA